MRKLAERSSRETKQIAGLIRDVQTGTRDAVLAMQDGAKQVEQGTARADQAGQALARILSAVHATGGQVDEIATAALALTGASRRLSESMEAIGAVVEENSASTEQMAAQSSDVSTAIRGIAGIAKEQSASMEEVSASAEEMSAQIEQISAQVQDLATTADEMRRLAGRFQLDATEAEVTTLPDNLVPLRRIA